MGRKLSRYIPAHDEQPAADCVIDIAASDGRYVVLVHISGGWDDRAISQPLRIESPVGTLKWKYPVHGADGMIATMASALVYGPGLAVRVVLPSGGAGKIGFLNVSYYYATEVEEGYT